ncbi:stage II sporulation protein E [Desulfofarcimen acetoxidans]|uniref:stage II sporulation protein E n=1 Tax=Desulfofarcimen acetoxidans TaxID=58138 RepID=UPI00068B05CF|nr:stage II sporulation protein E [Desulfofarcimen acetoxidans]
MFEKTDAYPYSREYGTKKTATPKTKEMFSDYQWFRLNQLFNWNSLMVFILGFFMGRVVLLGELMPFGPAFVSAGLSLGFGPAVVLGAVAGLFSVLQGMELVARFVIIVCLVGVYYSVPKNLRAHPVVLPGVVGAVALVVRTVYLSMSDPVPYNYVSSAFEAFIAALLSFVYLRSLPLLTLVCGERTKKLSAERVFYLLLLLGGLIAGSAGIGYANITLQGLLSRLVVLIAAYAGGTGMGAAVGALVGVLPGLVFTAMPALVGAYSFAGLLAGFSRRFGKAGSILGFVLGNIILCVYMSGYDRLTGVLGETGLASLIFFLLPDRIMRCWSSLRTENHMPLVDSGDKDCPQNNRFKEILAYRIQGMATVFQELFKSYEQSALADLSTHEDRSPQDLVDEIVRRVCGDCPLHRICWEKDFYRTYQYLLDMLARAEASDSRDLDNIPQFLRSRCTRIKELWLTVLCLNELYSAKKLWFGRMKKSREIISEQLKTVCHITDKLVEELQASAGLFEHHDFDLLASLKEKGLDIFDVYTTRQPGGHLEVVINMPSCRGMINCRYKVAPVLTELLGQPYSVVGMNCFSHQKGTERNIMGQESAGYCNFRLYPSLLYRLEVGMARSGKGGSDICGDSYSVVYLNQGKVALILSDGMGSGVSAELESSMTIRLLERLLKSGLEREPAIRMVNSVMLMRSAEDSFATIDLVIIDLCNGSSEFVKIGAPPGYLVRGKRVAPITSSALPIGIIDDIEITTVAKTLVDGDMLVMVTDGVTDACRTSDHEEDWLLKVLPETRNLPPQEVAEFIMQLAQTCSEKDNKYDDMIVMAVRIEKEGI